MPPQIKVYNDLVSQVNELTSKYTIKEIKNDKDKLKYIENLVGYRLKSNGYVVNERKVVAQIKEVHSLKADEIGVIKVNATLNPISFFITNKDDFLQDIINHKAISSIIVCGEKAYEDINIDEIALFKQKSFCCFDKICVNQLAKVTSKNLIEVTSEEKQQLSSRTLNFLKKLYFDNCIGKDFEASKDDVLFNLTAYTKFLENENFILTALNQQNKIADVRVINIGREDASLVSTTGIINFIKENSNCLSFCSFHNHPSGKVKPSYADVKVWKSVQVLAEAFGVNIVNDYILGHHSYYSRRLDKEIEIKELQSKEQTTYWLIDDHEGKDKFEDFSGRKLDRLMLKKLQRLDQANLGSIEIYRFYLQRNINGKRETMTLDVGKGVEKNQAIYQKIALDIKNRIPKLENLS